MKEFSYLEPDTVEEALELLDRYRDDAKVIAGGTALVNFMKNELVDVRFVIGLRRLKALTDMTITEDKGLHIGALTTLHTLETSPLVATNAPLLTLACRHVATIRIRMMATLGGAIVYADPALDTPPALIASDARIEVRSHRATRVIAANNFFKGIFETALEPDELVTAIVVPRQPKQSGTAYIKFLPATHDDYATVSVAARVALTDGRISDARIALGSVGPTVVRAANAEVALLGKLAENDSFVVAAELAARDVDPFTDFRGSADYKRRMSAVHVRRALLAATSTISSAVY